MTDLLTNGRGRIRCFDYRDDPEGCTGDGWAKYWELGGDSFGRIVTCYDHSAVKREERLDRLRASLGLRGYMEL